MAVIKKSGILNWNKENIQKAPDATGVYVLRQADKEIPNGYIGRTREPRRLRKRLLDHWRDKDIPDVAYFEWHQTDSEDYAKRLEDNWIKQYQPKYNSQQK